MRSTSCAGICWRRALDPGLEPYNRPIAAHRASHQAPGSHSAGGFRLVVIDRDHEFQAALVRRAEVRGWAVDALDTEIPPTPARLTAMKVDALLLDPAGLGARGEPYLRELCERLPNLGLLVCTERSSLAVRVRGLRAGVDDWLTKPFHPEEVIARIEAVSRPRRGGGTAGAVAPFAVGDLELDPRHFQAFLGGASIDLTRREFELLHFLAAANDQVLEREQIYQRVWGYAMAHGDRSVDVFVRKLRDKLKAHSPNHLYIHTHFGIGYRFEAAATERAAPGPRPAEQPERTTERDRALALRA